MEEQKKIDMECHHCEYKWIYNGKQKYYATCPNCRYKVNINKNKKKR